MLISIRDKSLWVKLPKTKLQSYAEKRAIVFLRCVEAQVTILFLRWEVEWVEIFVQRIA